MTAILDRNDVQLFKTARKRKSPPASSASDLQRTPAVAPETTASAPQASNEQNFRNLGVSQWLENVCSSLGITLPTPVQSGCIPAILQGRNVIATAHTGSGKTAAFALPILQCLSADPFGVYALVLTPTRELAFQLADQFRAFGAGMTLKVAVVIGGLDMQTQSKALAERPHVVVATPGRLRDLITGNQQLSEAFARARFLVLDEADRLLDPTFESELRYIAAALPADRQTLLFSATMTRSLIALQSSALQDAYCFQEYEGLSTPHPLKEQYLLLPAKVKEVYLVHLLEQLEDMKIRSAMLFCSTCKGCRLLGYVLGELGIDCAALHSHQTQGRRLAALDRFRSGRTQLLLATDVGSRGLDIPAVDLVINYDLPVLARDYVHRVGRTARAGRTGWAVSFVTQYDVELVRQIEKLIGHELEAYDLKEAEVLKSISRVFKAHRKAAMQAAEHEQAEERRGVHKPRRKKAAAP